MRSALSRNGVSSPLGKRTEEVRAKVTGEIKDKLSQACRDVGMSESEFLSVLLEVRFGGIDHAAKLHTDRIRVVAGMSDERGG